MHYEIRMPVCSGMFSFRKENRVKELKKEGRKVLKMSLGSKNRRNRVKERSDK